MLGIFDIETPLARNRFTVNVLTAMDDKVVSEGRVRSYPIRMFYVVRSLFDNCIVDLFISIYCKMLFPYCYVCYRGRHLWASGVKSMFITYTKHTS